MTKSRLATPWAGTRASCWGTSAGSRRPQSQLPRRSGCVVEESDSAPSARGNGTPVTWARESALGLDPQRPRAARAPLSDNATQGLSTQGHGALLPKSQWSWVTNGVCPCVWVCLCGCAQGGGAFRGDKGLLPFRAGRVQTRNWKQKEIGLLPIANLQRVLSY